MKYPDEKSRHLISSAQHILPLLLGPRWSSCQIAHLPSRFSLNHGRVTPGFRTCDLCRTMSLVGRFSWGTSVSPVPSCQRCSITEPHSMSQLRDGGSLRAPDKNATYCGCYLRPKVQPRTILLPLLLKPRGIWVLSKKKLMILDVTIWAMLLHRRVGGYIRINHFTHISCPAY